MARPSLHAIVTSLERGAGVGPSTGAVAAAKVPGVDVCTRSVRTGSSRIATAVVAASFVVSAAIPATMYGPPGWQIFRPLLFFGAGGIAAGLLI